MFDTKTCKIMIGAGNNRAFKKVCELLGRPELAEAEFREALTLVA